MIDTQAPGTLASGARDLPYYNFDKLYSYNGVYNFVCGPRGVGKTYGAKFKAIKKFLRDGEQFIYLRRYKTELNTVRGFFADIAHEFKGIHFRINGKQFEVCREPKNNPKENVWEIMGYFFALSIAQSLKGMSFHEVRTIIFDEFIIEKGAVHYLPDEATVFTNFYSTVDRNKDKTRVLFLANSVSIENPYFIKYKIRPDETGEFVVSHNGFIIAHFHDADKFSTEVYKTRFGQFIKNSEYADYALGNQFADNHKTMIAKKPSEAEYAYTLETIDGTFSVWYNRSDGTYYLLERRPGNELLFTMIPQRVDENKRLLLKNNEHLRILRAAFTNGIMYFDSPHTRNAMLQVFT